MPFEIPPDELELPILLENTVPLAADYAAATGMDLATILARCQTAVTKRFNANNPQGAYLFLADVAQRNAHLNGLGDPTVQPHFLFGIDSRLELNNP